VWWPGSCHEHELIELAGLDNALDEVEVASLLDRGFRGLAKAREHWHAPVGDRRTKDQLTDGQRAYNRLQAGLRALVEQAIGHLANAWALRRWRGLLYRVRDVFRPLARWCALAGGSTGYRPEEHRGHRHWRDMAMRISLSVSVMRSPLRSTVTPCRVPVKRNGAW
jgi:hypothetical protein